ncbi:MAG: DUF1190 domain-containing protein [Magnetospirillum gryphiswaldense]|nr:DUF1190 domain-containing protein [Magnetospirillum gryphiswaldense]
MRRSRRVASLTLGGASLLLLGACDDDKTLDLPPRLRVYPDVAACMSMGRPEGLCRTAQESATRLHFEKAPRQPSLKACETLYGAGNCAMIYDRDGWLRFIPAMAAFVPGADIGMGSAVPVHYDRDGYARVTGMEQRLGRSCQIEDGQPIICDSSGQGGSGSVYHRRSGVTQIVDTTTGDMGRVTRGGFGRATGLSHVSFGG